MAAAPNYQHVLTQYATRYYRDLCLFEFAQRPLERAVLLDPINAGPRTSLSFVHRYQGQFDEALAEANRALSINPRHGYAILAKVLALISMEYFSECYRVIREVGSWLSAHNILVLSGWARLYASTGEFEKAHAYRERVIEMTHKQGGEKFTPLAGWLAMMLGRIEESIFWLQAALDNQISQVLNVRVFAAILPGESVLPIPEFQDFLRQMNLDDQSLCKLRLNGGLDDVYLPAMTKIS